VKTYFSDESLPEDFADSVFLAGPTPRDSTLKSWRPRAVEMLSFGGTFKKCFVPERKNWKDGFDYIEQVEWELEALKKCSVVMFWVPRDMKTMPALTTNVEFGMLVKDSRSVYGRPEDAASCKYLDYVYKKFRGLRPAPDLQILVSTAENTLVNSWRNR